MYPDVIYEHASLRFSMDDRQTLEGESPQMRFEKLQKLDPVEGIPEDFVMVARVAMLLRGIVIILYLVVLLFYKFEIF